MNITEIPMPTNSDRISTDVDGKLELDTFGWAESNGGGGDLSRVVMAPDRAPKVVNPSMTDQRQIGSPSGCDWSENTEGIVGSKTQVITSPETGEIAANWSGSSAASIGSFPNAFRRQD